MGLTGCAFAVLTAASTAYAVDRGGRALKTSALLLLATWIFSVTVGKGLHAEYKPYVYAWVDGVLAGVLAIILMGRIQRWRAVLFSLALVQMGLHIAMLGFWDFSLHARRLHVFSLNLTYALELLTLTCGAVVYRPDEPGDIPEVVEGEKILDWLECVDKAGIARL
uniref:Uncharacterized protein n=1 Tax=Caulobacter phage BL57 TaxID=3348355 RepID=A0AB74UN58_9VIRU